MAEWESSTPNRPQLIWMIQGSVEGAVQVLDRGAPIPQEFGMETDLLVFSRMAVRKIIVRPKKVQNSEKRGHNSRFALDFSNRS